MDLGTMRMRPYIIVDVGSNWKTSNNESDNLIMAKRHIHDAAKIGVSAVKFQFFTDEELYGMPGPNKWSLPASWLPELAAYAAAQNIDFMCSAFSMRGFCQVDAFVNVHKIASAEMKDRHILGHVAALNKPFLISTGGAHEKEIESVANFLFDRGRVPTQDFAFLQCVAAYPAKPRDYNLHCLELGLSIGNDEHECVYEPIIGVSDHTLSNVVALTALGLGAMVFEKHFHACNLPGISTPDQRVSIGPLQLNEYVTQIREGFTALGNGKKCPAPCEKDMTLRHRRRLKVISAVPEGGTLVYGVNFGSFRSIVEDAEAAPPEMSMEFDGKKAKRALSPGDPVWTSTVEI